MNLRISFSKKTKALVKTTIVLLVAFPLLTVAQVNKKQQINFVQRASSPLINGKTEVTTCPTSPIILQAVDTSGVNTYNTNHNFGCNPAPFYIRPNKGSTTNALNAPYAPCFTTDYNTFQNNLATNVTENFYQNGVNIYCVGPSASCGGGVIGGGTTLGGAVWDFSLFGFTPSQSHAFEFCTAGTITTTSITIQDCWNGNPIASTPAAPVVLSNATANPCFTVSVAPGLDIGTATYSINPASAANGLTNFGDGQCYINTDSLAAGTYTVTYNFQPSIASNCPGVNGTFKFTIGASPTVTVNSPTICAGGTATLTAHSTAAGTTYSWSPSAGLSSANSATVTTTNSPTATTTYTVRGTKNGCTASATATITVSNPTFTVNAGKICSGDSVQLKGSDTSLAYTWAPAAGLSATSGDSVKASPAATTIYTVTASNTLGCTIPVFFDTVKVNANPNLTVNYPTVCAGTTATLTASGAHSYTWSPAANLFPANGVGNPVWVYNTNVPGPYGYTVTATDTNGCVSSKATSVTISDSLGVYLYAPAICFGSSAVIYAGGGVTYTWTPSVPTLTYNPFNNPHADSVIYIPNPPLGSTTFTVISESDSGTTCFGRQVVTLVVHPTPTVTAVAPSMTTICAGTTTTLTATGADNHYNWSNGTTATAADSIVTVTPPAGVNTYTATGFNSFGCSDTTTFIVNVTPLPNYTVNSPTICSGNDAVLTATPASSVTATYSYTWTPSTNLSATNTASVTVINPPSPNNVVYTVTATDGGICPVAHQSTVTVNQTPTVSSISFNANPICAGTTATLTANGNAATYSWASSSGLSVASSTATTTTDAPTVTATYTVIGTSAVGNCTATATNTLTVNPTPVFTISNGGPICTGKVDTLKIIPSGTVSASYTWTPSTNLSVITNTMAVANPTATTASVTVNYTVNALSVNNCPYTQVTTVTVNPLPILNVTASPTLICAGSDATLTATSSNNISSYNWTPSVTGTGSSVTANPANTTTYNVTGTDNNGCVTLNPASTVVNVTPALAPATPSVVTSSGIANSACAGQSYTLTTGAITGATSYGWVGSSGNPSNGQTVVVPTNSATATGTYTYNLVVASGTCAATPITVTVSVNPKPNVFITSASPICAGQSAQLTANGANNYTWSAGTTPGNGSVVSVSPTTTSSYTVVGTDVNNCVSQGVTSVVVNTFSTAITPNPPTGDAPLNVTFTNGSVGGNNYSWDYNNGLTQTTTNVNANTSTTYTAPGTYTVTMVATSTLAACPTSTTTCIVIVTETYAITIPNIFTPNSDGINDNFFVKSEGVASMNMIIYDRWGTKVFESSATNAVWDGKINGKEVSDGTYFYIINATSKKGGTTDYKGDITVIR